MAKKEKRVKEKRVKKEKPKNELFDLPWRKIFGGIGLLARVLKNDKSFG